MPRAEREWLSCTNAASMPASANVARVEGLEEEAAGVAEHLRLDDQHARQSRSR